jgi:hypothetical protein
MLVFFETKSNDYNLMNLGFGKDPLGKTAWLL